MITYILVNKNGVDSKMSRKFGNQELIISSYVCIENNQIKYKHYVLEKKYTHEEIKSIRNNINDLDILKCEISDIKIDKIFPGENIYRGIINTFEKIDYLEELSQIKNSLLETRILKSNFFDNVEYQLIDECIYTKCIIDNKEIDINIDFRINQEITKIENNILQLTDFSSNLLQNIDILNIKTFIANEFLESANSWAEGDEYIDLDKFINKISLCCFSIYEDFEYTITFDDGGIFAGHGIHAKGTKDRGIIEAYMQ